MRDKKILVTGGAGFIGGHLVEKLVEKNDVLVIDNLSEGGAEKLHEEARLREIDIRDEAKLTETVEKFNPEIVFHLAAFNDAMGSIENPIHTIETNITGTVNLLEACKDIDIRKFVYASSGGLSYGEPENIPTRESENIRPVYPYGVSKACGSLFIADYGRRYDLDYTVMRLGSVYGPGANGGVIKNFFERIIEGERPIIYGDGTQTRDFIHVSDVVSGLIKASQNGSGIYNLGTENRTSVNELIDKFEAVTGRDLDPKYEERWNGDIDECRLSIDKARRDLGWEPKIDLMEGLEECRDFYLK
jgi:UDP-glucose 4-epimerase